MTSNRDDPLHAMIERSLTLAEAEAYMSAPVSDDERQHTLQLVEWFVRRYPTPIERLRYVTRAYRRWQGRPRQFS